MMRARFIFFFLCLLIFPSAELGAQSKKERLQGLADRHYDMGLLKMSEAGRWVASRKLYDRNRDTLLILDNSHPEKPIGQKVITGEYFFPDNDHLLNRNRQSVELWNLKKQTGICFEDVRGMDMLKNKGLFVLHYNEEVDNRVGIYDTSGKMLQSVDQATMFIVSEDDLLYVITVEDEEKYQLLRLNGEGKEQLYASHREIQHLEVYSERQGLIIHEKNPESRAVSISYLDLKTKKVYPLEEILPINPLQVFTGTIDGGESYFLRVVVDYEQQDTSLVDIWYGNDYRLEKKFYPHPVYAYYIWKPVAKQIDEVGEGRSVEKVSLGDGRYILSFDRFLLQDYTTFTPELKIDIYDRQEDSCFVMDTIRTLYSSPGGQYLLYPKDSIWYSYHVSSGMKKTVGGNQRLALDKLMTPYFTPDGEGAFFDGDDVWWNYNLKQNRLSKLGDFDGYRVTILNGNSKVTVPGMRLELNTLDPEKPVLLRLYDPNENKTAYILHENGRNETLVPFTGMNIRELKYDNGYNHFCYIEENYNCPPRIVHKQPGKEKSIVFQTNEDDSDILSLRQEIISYANSDGIPLKGILYYPLHYTPSKKYPMVMSIYKTQSHKQNRYPVAAFGRINSDGFNLRILLEEGYFVFFPDIIYGDMGPGLSALDCVNHSLDALEHDQSIDKNRIGLFGFSHGGYETNFIATHSDRFATYISGAGNSDIVRSYFSYNYNFLIPFYFQYEAGQYEMKKSFSEDKELYFRNNPIHYVDRVNAPILIWTGKKDQNIYWEQTMEFYIGLKRSRKKVIALFYPEEGHAFFVQEACSDISLRILDWYDYFLKGEKSIDWIERMYSSD